MLNRWKPIDIISLIIILGCFILLAIGRDTVISWTLLAIVAGRYGIDIPSIIRKQTPRK